MSDAEIATKWADALSDYRNHRIVKPLVDDHQGDAVWTARIGPLRDASYGSASRSFQLMRSVLRARHCVAGNFRDLYSVPPKGTRRGVTVAEACGGCAACRRLGEEPYEMEPAPPWSPWHEYESLEPVLKAEFAGHQALAVFHDGFATKLQQRRLERFIQWMAHQRVQNLIAPAYIAGVLRERLRQFSVPIFLFTKYEPLYLQPFASVVVMPDAESVQEFGPAMRSGRLTVLLLHRTAADPEAPHRRLRDILSCRTFGFDEFMNRIGL